jgi:hypothetical protein
MKYGDIIVIPGKLQYPESDMSDPDRVTLGSGQISYHEVDTGVLCLCVGLEASLNSPTLSIQ